MNAAEIPAMAPAICESCARVSLIVDGVPRVATDEELRQIMKSPAWKDVLEPVHNLILERKPPAVEPEPPPVDRTQTTLTDGSPVTPDHREIGPDGMQRGYVVLSAEERAKGFVRPYREVYTHVGVRPQYPLRPLTPEEELRYAGTGYVAFEVYPPSEAPRTGRYWTARQLDSGCGTETRMGYALSATYARDPKFYGATFCCCCRTHFPVAEFVWTGTDDRVGS